MLEPTDFPGFLKNLGDVADIMRVDTVRLVLESVQDQDAETLRLLDGMLVQAGKGAVEILGVELFCELLVAQASA